MIVLLSVTIRPLSINVFIPLSLVDNRLKENAKRKLINSETTLAPKADDDKTHPVGGDRQGIRDAGLIMFNYGEGIPALRQYVDDYLPNRQAQIEELEQSVLLIREAIADPDRNPWVEQKRDRKKAAEEAQARLDALLSLPPAPHEEQ